MFSAVFTHVQVPDTLNLSTGRQWDPSHPTSARRHSMPHSFVKIVIFTNGVYSLSQLALNKLKCAVRQWVKAHPCLDDLFKTHYQ